MRWSLYVASQATPGSSATFTPDGIESKLTGSVRAVASGASAPKPRLEQPALSLSHLTWSLGTSITFRTCHRTTSFPV